MYYVVDVCKCDYCEERGVYEPLVYEYEIGQLPLEDCRKSHYWVTRELPEVIYRTFDRQDETVRDYLIDADKQLLHDYNVTMKDKLRLDTLRYVDLERIES